MPLSGTSHGSAINHAFLMFLYFFILFSTTEIHRVPLQLFFIVLQDLSRLLINVGNLFTLRVEAQGINAKSNYYR